MQHVWARQTISRLLAGSGLGAGAVVIASAAELHERVGGMIGTTLWDLALSQEPEQAALYTGPLNQQSVPNDAVGLLSQLAPIVVANPSDTGLNISLLALLADLWPHVSTDERPLLRVRFLNSLMERAGEVGNRGAVSREAVVTSAELKVWNRYMPTATGDAALADLPKLLSAPSAQEAYHLLADHLIGGLDGGTLARILGSLTVQVADQRRDTNGELLLPLAGAVAAERLAASCPADSYTTLLSQLANQVWWCVNLAELPRRTADEPAVADIAAGIIAGSAMGVRRCARSLSLDEAGWWAALAPAIAAVAARGPAQLQRAVIATWTLSVRSRNRVIAPDDAAAISAILADGMKSEATSDK